MQFPIHIPFVENLGFELVRFQDGEAEIHIEPRDALMNSFQVVHGGVTMTLLDVVMAHAARSPNEGGLPEARGVVTVEMKTSFMRPGLGRLKAHGKVLHQTPTMAFTEGAVVNEQEELVAHATGTFKYVKRLPVTTPEGLRHVSGLNASD
jgi:uncharacterized protein (TIGR00369 family)